MDNHLINNQLREAAIRCGLCEKWKGEWKKDWAEAELVDRFFRGIDFFFKTRFINADFVEKTFQKDFLRGNAILANDEYSLTNPRQKERDTYYAALLGKSSAVIRLNGKNMATVYLSDEASATIIARNNAWMLVHLYDNASVDITKKDNAHVTVIRHSQTAKVASNEILNVKDDLD